VVRGGNRQDLGKKRFLIILEVLKNKN